MTSWQLILFDTAIALQFFFNSLSLHLELQKNTHTELDTTGWRFECDRKLQLQKQIYQWEQIRTKISIEKGS
ncbi:MAG: hypothetical protein V7L01_11325 [Nostoc sp.]|uniref:hypothetical protein n=1 Tax=Nostoc sp. TaxID=1180 RepID=UPI002FFAC09E